MDLEKATAKEAYHFLQGGGEMGALTRDIDWARTALGPHAEWPQSLKTTLGILLNAAFPMFLFWGDELTCFYNDSFRPSLGVDGKHPAIGRSGKDVWPEIWEFIGPLIYKVKNTGEPVWFEDQLVPFYRNGKIEEIYWTFSYNPVRGETGNIDGVLVVCTETTDKVENLKKLDTANRQFRDMVMQAPVAIAVFRGDGFVAEIANDAYLPLAAKTREEFVGKPLFESLPETKEILLPIVQDVVRTGVPFRASEFEIVIHRHGRNEKCYFNLVYEPLRVTDGTINGFMVVAHEVTAQVLAKKVLEESETRFRNLADQVPMMVFMADADGNVTYWNKKWLEFTGQEPKEALGNGWRAITHPEDYTLLLDSYLAATGARQSYAVEIRMMRADGQYRYLLFTGEPRFSSAGDFEGYAGTGIDITDRKNAEVALRESENRYRTLIEEGTVANALYLGADIRIAFANDTMIGYWGKDTGVIGKTFREALPELENQPFPDLLDAVYATGETYIGREARADLVVDGMLQPYYFNFTYKALRNAAGEIYGIYHSAIDVTGQVIARKKIEQSEQQVRSLVESAPFPIGMYVGEEMTIQLANQAILDVWDKGDDVIGKRYTEILPELENQEIFDQLRNVFRTGVSFMARNRRVELITDGKSKVYYFNYNFTPLFDAAGNVYGVMNTAAEVTDLNLAKQKVEESERLFRNLITEATVATAVLTGENMILELANEKMLHIWDRDVSIIGKALLEFMPELKDQAFPKILDRVYTTGETYSDEDALVYIKRKGKLEAIYMDFSYKALMDEKGAINRILVSAIDITERVLARKRLAQSEANLRNTILKAPVAMCIFKGPQQVVEIANDRMIELWGKTVDDVINKPIFEGLPEARDQGFEQLLSDVLTTGEAFVAQCVPITLPREGKIEVVYVNFVYEAYREANGKISGVMAVAIDVTAQVLARQKIEEMVAERTKELAEANSSLQRSNAELAQFAYIASHDLQEPLRKVSTFTEMLEQSLGAVNDRSKNYLDRISSATSRMTKLIRDVLAYSQLSKENEIFEPVDLNEIIEDIKADFELLIEQKQAAIRCIGLPEIEALPLQMSQLFGNLISNALKFIRPGVPPLITIQAQVLSREETTAHTGLDADTLYWNIEVRDNGIGFNQEYAEQIFNIFQRLHGKAEYAGTGIGLAMCKKIAQNHHGDIYATANAESGAIFNVILPQLQR